MTDDYEDLARLLEALPDSVPPRRCTPIQQLRAALEPVAQEATRLRWAEPRPWLLESRVKMEDGLCAVDLHNLDRRLAREAIYAVLDTLAQGQSVRLIHGRGTHSGGPSSLRQAVRELLRRFDGYGRVRIVDEAEGHVDFIVGIQIRSAS